MSILFPNQPVACYSCGGIFAPETLVAIAEIPGYRWPRYCPACAEEIRAAYDRTCMLCGAGYLARLPGGPDGLCPGCTSEERLAELARVRQHQARARDLGLPATLTLAAWLGAVEHFGGLCAYCRERPYGALDHFIPLSAGGGTTAANCVPACAVCNSEKGCADPHAVLAPGVVARVQAYLHGAERPKRT